MSDTSVFDNMLFHERRQTEAERMRPFVLLRPRMFPDGNQWCALYGENLQDGVCAFGDTPDAASRAFDAEWLTQKAGSQS